jgi:hypothetical protein
MATTMAMVMARAYMNPSLMNLPLFGDVVEIASFCTFRMNWPLVGISRMAMTYVCHLFSCKLFVFSRFGCANLLKLASLLELTKKASANKMHHAAARASQLDRTAMLFVSKARRKQTRTDGLRRPTLEMP